MHRRTFAVSPSRRTSSLARAVVSSPHRFEGTEPMPTSFRERHDDGFMLLPVDLRDWLPEDHLAYPVMDMV